MNITIYSTSTCPYCKMLKDYLEEMSITYTEKLVDIDESARNEMTQKSEGYLGVPFSVVENNGVEIKIIGFDKQKFDEALEGGK